MLWNSTQCNRRVCRKAERPSIRQSTDTVKIAQKEKMTQRMTPPYLKAKTYDDVDAS